MPKIESIAKFKWQILNRVKKRQNVFFLWESIQLDYFLDIFSHDLNFFIRFIPSVLNIFIIVYFYHLPFFAHVERIFVSWAHFCRVFFFHSFFKF